MYSHECRLCGATVPAEVWGGGECVVCGSVSATTLPTKKELQCFYQKFNENYDGGHTGGGNLIRYAHVYLKILQRHTCQGRLIDIGSSTNPFPNIAANAGYSVTVLDYVKPKILDSRVAFIEGNLDVDDSWLLSNRHIYDAVTAWAVLEHVSDPRLAASRLASICKPGGVILISTPEIGTFLTRNSIGRSGWFYPPMHLHLISPQAMQTMFAEHGCDPLYWGRLELNRFRYMARYGIGIAETLIGSTIKQMFHIRWEKLRASKVQRFKGITYFVFQKRTSR